MKKTYLVIALAIGMIVNAQHVEKGTKLISLSLGSASMVITSFEYGISEKITIGPYIGIWNIDSTLSNGYSSDLRYYSYGALGNYHFYQDEKWDVYGGAVLGYQKAIVNDNDPDYSSSSHEFSSPVLGITGGGRYFFSDDFAGNIEFGFGGWLGKIGLTYKF